MFKRNDKIWISDTTNDMVFSGVIKRHLTDRMFDCYELTNGMIKSIDDIHTTLSDAQGRMLWYFAQEMEKLAVETKQISDRFNTFAFSRDRNLLV